MSTVKLKITSALEKCFHDERFDDIPELPCASLLYEEDFSFQAHYIDTDVANLSKKLAYVKIESEVAEFITASRVENVAVRFPVYNHKTDDNYLRKTPGLYPELLIPLQDKETVFIVTNELKSLWFDLKIPLGTSIDHFAIKVSLVDTDGTEIASAKINFELIGAALPPQELIFTQWFHCDCIADYYGVEVFSERHWRLMNEFIKTATDNGMNMILTPVLTPPLDTVVGGERPTVQLVDIMYENGQYQFGFDKLERWVNLCKSNGIKYYEISHLFTQWGAKHAPKVMATVDGEYRRIFGWETEASGSAYATFLEAFLAALNKELERLGIAENAYFHISDEPSASQLESYLAAKAIVKEPLKGKNIIDALSDIAFYNSGAVEHPIPSNDHIVPFIEANVPELWTYYCCGQDREVSNRFLSMPSARNRIIGLQMYKYNIAGFLHWGYNFYYSQNSVRKVNPYQCNDGDYFAPAGDLFSVYPSDDGKALATIRLKVFAHALCDMRALKLCEQLCGREAVIKVLENDGTLTFKKYPKEAGYILGVREKINAMIKSQLKG